MADIRQVIVLGGNCPVAVVLIQFFLFCLCVCTDCILSALLPLLPRCCGTRNSGQVFGVMLQTAATNLLIAVCSAVKGQWQPRQSFWLCFHSFSTATLLRVLEHQQKPARHSNSSLSCVDHAANSRQHGRRKEGAGRLIPLDLWIWYFAINVWTF